MLCLCGETHADCVTRLAVSHETADNASPCWDALLNQWMDEAGYRSLLLVADANTAYAVRRVRSALCVPHVRMHIYDDPLLVPDEYAVQRLLDAASSGAPPYDALISVGAGTLNDLTRYVSHKLGLPYYVVATAASMDGYTSSVAPLIVNGLKLTFPAHAPLGVIGDDIFLASSPAEMTAAGYGDMAGKCTSVNDWELEHIFTTATNTVASAGANTKKATAKEATAKEATAKEATAKEATAKEAITKEAAANGHFCPVLAGYMRRITADCMECSPRDRLLILRFLLESGLVMQRAGHSKPASGSEHHLSHFWEMQALLQGRTPALHGAKVGVATLMSLQVNKWLLEEPADFSRAYKRAECFDKDRWQADIRRVFGKAAEGVLRQWPHESVATNKHILDVVQAQWDAIRAVISRNLPDVATVKAGLTRMGAPVTAYEIGVSRDDVINGVLHAQRIRQRFTVWRIADALGRLPEFAERLALMAE